MAAAVMVTVPATTANLGPGFDCLGAALARYNRFQFEPRAAGAPAVDVSATGAGAHRVSTDSSNLAYRAFCALYQHLDRTPPCIRIAIALDVPLSRGLGSSATAIVAGLVGGNQLAGHPLDAAALAELAIALEGHPDNVVPALLGGCQLAAPQPDGSWQWCRLPWHSAIVPVVAVPNFELATQQARAVLPERVERAAAIANLGALGLLLRGLALGYGPWVQAGMADALHQPYRQDLIRGYAPVRAAALAAGAHGIAISGAGPALVALSNAGMAEAVAAAIAQAWQREGVTAEAQALALDEGGAWNRAHAAA